MMRMPLLRTGRDASPISVRAPVAALRAFLLLACTSALAQPQPAASDAVDTPACRVGRFQGATAAEGAIVRMRVVNTGKPCAIASYGMPAERQHPAGAGRIVAPPAHGKAEFVAPEARYTPEPGYAGDDEFAYEATARGRGDQPLRLKVQVQVKVVAR